MITNKNNVYHNSFNIYGKLLQKLVTMEIQSYPVLSLKAENTKQLFNLFGDEIYGKKIV